MSNNKNDFEGPDFDSADALQEDARIDALEVAFGCQRRVQQQQAFEQQVLQYAVNSCLNSCLDGLDLLYVPREANPISDIAIAHDSWRQEAEPQPCSRDSWLRGVIPESPAIPRALSPANPLAVTTSNKDRPQSGLTVRRGGPGSVASTTERGEPGQRRTTTSAGSNRSRPPAAVNQAAAKPSSTSTAPKPIASSKSAGKQLTQEQQEAEARLRQELQIRRQQAAIAKELKQKDEQARTALLSMQKELKGKDYTYDSSGKVVMLNKITPETLPAPPGPQFKVHSTAAADSDPAANPAAAKTAKSSSSSISSPAATAGKAKTGKKAAAANSSTEFLQTASVTQPPVLETLKPAAGVTLRAGAAAKQGPRREAGGQTRIQYQQQAKAQNQQAARVVRSAVQPGAARAPPPAGAAAVSSVNSNHSNSSRSSSALGSSSSSSSSSSSQTAAAAADFSSRLNGAAAGTAGALQPAPSNTAAAAAGKAAAGGAGRLRRPASPDVNLVLVAAADWGVAAGAGYTPPQSAEVTRPDVKQIREEFGRTTHLPKLRAPVATIKPPSAQPGSTVTAKTLMGATGGGRLQQ